MYAVAAPILNRIAKSEDLKSPIAKRLFPLDQEKLNAALETEEKKLEAKGVDPKVALALLTVGPMLWENRAIQSFVRKNQTYLGTMPDLSEPNEALLQATHEFSLNTSQQAQLQPLLVTPLT